MKKILICLLVLVMALSNLSMASADGVDGEETDEYENTIEDVEEIDANDEFDFELDDEPYEEEPGTEQSNTIAEKYTYDCVFSDNLDGRLAGKYSWWDPATQYQYGKRGNCIFSQGKLNLSSDSAISIINRDKGEEATSFSEGVLEMDLDWNCGTVNNNATLSILFGLKKDGGYADSIVFYPNKVVATNSGSQVDITSGVPGVEKPNFKDGKKYRIKIYILN